ncbi:MAG: undecaprenyl-diphosphatase UppP [Candidatus Buchananbacteria bacterium]
MTNIIFSILAGIIQGLTEFLPVSSSAHLIFFHDLFGFEFIDNLAFDVILHLGTMVAILFCFLPELWRYFMAGLKSLSHWNLREDKEQLLAWSILVATIPAAIVGFLFEKSIENLFRNPLLVAAVMIIFGAILLVIDKLAPQTKRIDEINLWDAFWVGLLQALALIPGVSRSGITIITGLSRNLKRQDAAKFSFLVSAPIMIGAGAKKTLDLFLDYSLSQSDLLVLLVGFLTSAVTGYFCIKLFLQYLNSHSLRVFAWYRIILGLGVLVAILIWKI